MLDGFFDGGLDVSKMSDVGFNSSIRSSSFPRDGAELGFSASTFFSMFGPEQPVPLQKKQRKISPAGWWFGTFFTFPKKLGMS